MLLGETKQSDVPFIVIRTNVFTTGTFFVKARANTAMPGKQLGPFSPRGTVLTLITSVLNTGFVFAEAQKGGSADQHR